MNTEQVKTIIIGVLAVAIIAASYFAFIGTPGLSGEKAANKAIDYVNSQVLTGANKASLDGPVVKESGLYKFNVKVGADSFPSYVSKDGKLLFPQVMKIEDAPASNDNNNPPASQKTIGEFTISNDEVCLEDGKPIVYFFGADSCPHCVWEYPIVQKVAGLFGGAISFHDNKNNTTRDADVFAKYSPEGGIPALVIGCKFYRVGTAEPETAEGALQAEKTFTSLICQATNNQPAELCNQQ